ncbi:hypothetical protein [Blastococcus sp. Marseille-P5729]|uniref:hypothetical protein n=1 Tax=Blastococcus sp. Marseille-P5729 TaxID=2086582 RepID=UPI000D10D755|nr:hypothetical protein [Blastococcus sp. Marseille-P5729]
MNPKDRTDTIDWDLLSLYMNDHVSGATAGVARLNHMAKQYQDTPHGENLSRIARELREERAFYLELIRRRELPQRSYRQALAWVGERVGRLKFNRRPLSTSPMTPVLESELMQSAIAGKISGWQTLTEYHEALGVGREVFQRFIEQAERQIADLESMHAWARRTAFYKVQDGESETGSPADPRKID